MRSRGNLMLCNSKICSTMLKLKPLLVFAAIVATWASTTSAQSRPPAPLDQYDANDRAAVMFNGARAEFAALNPASRSLPKYKIPLDPPTFDRSSREEVLAMYHGSFGMQAKWAPYWTGDIATCNYGTTKRSYQESVAARTNWWRAFVGRPNSLSYKLDSLQTRLSQAGAVALEASNRLTHDIDPSFKCFSDDARVGAWSNLDPNPWTDAASVDGYVIDAGYSNTYAGHRANLLLGNNRLVGAGSTGGGLGSLGDWATNARVGALGVRSTIGVARPDPVVAWPPAGLFLRHHIWLRWSYANSTLRTAANATVAVTRNGIPVPANVTYRTGFEELNDAMLVWDLPTTEGPNTFNPINSGHDDHVYTVTISNLTAFDGSPVTVEYRVTAIDAFPGYSDWNGDQTATAVQEYYWPERDTYFVSLSRDDAEALDEVSSDLYRTWRGFYAWASASTALAADTTAVPVCRWFFKAPTSSHFYSAKKADCDLLKATYGNKPDVAVEDTPNAFYVAPPTAAGTCDPKYQPVFRLFNNQVGTGKAANHRYTAHPSDVRELVARGWLNEGVAFCAPRKKELYPGKGGSDYLWF